jgi:hypothetical protein
MRKPDTHSKVQSSALWKWKAKLIVQIDFYVHVHVHVYIYTYIILHSVPST